MDEANENDMKLKFVRMNQRNMSKRWLGNTENEGNCPIILSNLTFVVFFMLPSKQKRNKKIMEQNILVKQSMDIFRVHCVIYINRRMFNFQMISTQI